jgi:hypothetical protein
VRLDGLVIRIDEWATTTGGVRTEIVAPEGRLLGRLDLSARGSS